MAIFNLDCRTHIAWCSQDLGAYYPPTSMTRLGDLLDFGQHFKAFGNN